MKDAEQATQGDGSKRAAPSLRRSAAHMKRSEVNSAIDAAMAFFAEKDFALPAYAFWTPDKWRSAGREYHEVCDTGLGWDVTDFGSGNLREIGRVIFTLRNGRRNDVRYPKPYAQKVMHMPEGQKSIMHYHRSKREDIHNLSGGSVLISLWGVGRDGRPLEESLRLSVTGCSLSVAAGSPVLLRPGEWICVPPGTFHQFWTEEGQGDVLATEVSSVCDDYGDNYFWPRGTRFPAIIEDESPRFVLCHEYCHYFMEN